jgi:HAD superfamily hydrolase (TIGR01509 family)
MQSRKYSVIVFDLGNVLIPFDYNVALEKLNKIDRNLGKKFWEYYRSNYKLHRDFERGEIGEEVFIDKMLHVLENKIDRKEFCRLYSEIFTENKKVTAIIPKLKRKYILVLMSNTNSIHMEFGWKDYPFIKLFDKLILSHQVNAVKPEKGIYEAVMRYTGKPPEEHIFIDDIEEYVEGAKLLGWDGIRFTGEDQLLQELRQKGILD